MSTMDLTKLKPGQEILVDGKRYGRCAHCKKVVRTDKPIVGSLHLCE